MCDDGSGCLCSTVIFRHCQPGPTPLFIRRLRLHCQRQHPTKLFQNWCKRKPRDGCGITAFEFERQFNPKISHCRLVCLRCTVVRQLRPLPNIGSTSSPSVTVGRWWQHWLHSCSGLKGNCQLLGAVLFNSEQWERNVSDIKFGGLVAQLCIKSYVAFVRVCWTEFEV